MASKDADQTPPNRPPPDIRSPETPSLDAPSQTSAPTPHEQEKQVLPIVEEQLRIGKAAIPIGNVRVSTTVHEREEIVELESPLMTEEVEVHRIPINEYVEEAQPVRYEENAIIVPVYEEVMVVQKRLLLREEIRITRQVSARREPQRVILRREEAHIERDLPDSQRKAG